MWTVMPSPVGDLRIVERDGAVVAIEFAPFRPPADGRPRGTPGRRPGAVETVRQLTAYFDGELTVFDLPLAPIGTDFQQRVWKQLAEIALRRDRVLRPDRRTPRDDQRGLTRGRPGQRSQPDPDRRARATG